MCFIRVNTSANQSNFTIFYAKAGCSVSVVILDPKYTILEFEHTVTEKMDIQHVTLEGGRLY